MQLSVKKPSSFFRTETLFVFFSTIANTFFLLYFLGVLKNKYALVETITFYLKIFISLFLIFQFNPFYPLTTHGNKLTNLDRNVAFAAGVSLLAVYAIEFYNKTFAILQNVQQHTVALAGTK